MSTSALCMHTHSCIHKHKIETAVWKNRYTVQYGQNAVLLLGVREHNRTFCIVRYLVK